MIRSKGWIPVCFLITVSFLAACQNEDAMKEEQVKLRSDLENAIAKVDREIDGMELNISTERNTAIDSLHMRVDRLEEARDNLQDQLDRMEDISAADWDAFQRSVQGSLDHAEQTLEWARNGRM